MGQICSEHPCFKRELAMYQRMAMSCKNWNKCFGIGANKTGTTSLHVLMSELFGFRAYQGRVEMLSTLQALRGNYRPLVEAMAQLDFHQDLPVSQGSIYVAVDALFPGSKFILTVRNSEAWWSSFLHQYKERLADILLNQPLKKPHYVCRGYSQQWLEFFWSEPIAILRNEMPENAKEDEQEALRYICNNKRFKQVCIRAYEGRNAGIREYFGRRPGDLLEIDVSRLECVSAVARFLGLPDVLRGPMPLANSSRKGEDLGDSRIRYCIDYALLCDHMVDSDIVFNT